MDRKKNIVFDLLKNQHFVRWVQHPAEESDHYWTKWISNHEAHKKDVEIARRIIQSGGLRNNHPISEEKYDMMLENIMNRARQSHGYGHNSYPGFRRYMGIAAAVTLVIIGSIFIMSDSFDFAGQPVEVSHLVKEAPNGSRLTTRLPDGTVVTLNSGSVISFPEKFEASTREVRLSGEAYFEVAHNPAQPFIVHFRDQQVRVLGTSFNIRSYEEEHLTSVAVASGKVSYSISGKEIILKQDEMASCQNGASRLQKGEVNRLEAFGWRDRILYFDSDRFDEIKVELERWFGVDIGTQGDFEPEGTFSGKFENASLKEVLTGLSFLYRFDFTIAGSTVSITRKSTNELPMKKE